MSFARSTISWLKTKLPTELFEKNQVAYWRFRHRFNVSYEGELLQLSSLIEPDQLVVDVGANFGQYTSVLSRTVGDGGEVISFEASKGTFNLLQRIVSLENVKLLNVALGETPGELPFYVPLDSDGQRLAGLGSFAKPKSKFIEEVVDVSTLDRELDGRDVSFVKIDVEGHELAVLEGGRETISRCHPVLLIETDDNRVDDLLGEYGYRSIKPPWLSPQNRLYQCSD